MSTIWPRHFWLPTWRAACLYAHIQANTLGLKCVLYWPRIEWISVSAKFNWDLWWTMNDGSTTFSSSSSSSGGSFLLGRKGFLSVSHKLQTQCRNIAQNYYHGHLTGSNVRQLRWKSNDDLCLRVAAASVFVDISYDLIWWKLKVVLDFSFISRQLSGSILILHWSNILPNQLFLSWLQSREGSIAKL